MKLNPIIIGATWGLISGIWYSTTSFAIGFTNINTPIFANVNIFWKIILLPAYTTDIISSTPTITTLASILGFYYFILWCIGIPIVIALLIILIISELTQK